MDKKTTAGFVNVMDEVAAKLQEVESLTLKEKTFVMKEIGTWIAENAEQLAGILSQWISIYMTLVSLIKDVGMLVIKVTPQLDANSKAIREESKKLNTVRLDMIKEEILLGRARNSFWRQKE